MKFKWGLEGTNKIRGLTMRGREGEEEKWFTCPGLDRSHVWVWKRS